jgi:hypothetical protein
MEVVIGEVKGIEVDIKKWVLKIKNTRGLKYS